MESFENRNNEIAVMKFAVIKFAKGEDPLYKNWQTLAEMARFDKNTRIYEK